jgi:uncharacterized RDD family membrane protein YckC
VWEAESRTTGRRVALKVLTPFATTTSNSLERFRQEGRLAAALFHPRSVYVFDAGAVNGVPFISMELMPGGTLADRLRAGPLPTTVAVDYLLDMLDGLEAAHSAGIIHRDLKPSNVFIDEQGRARIGDFGISKSLDGGAGLTATGGFLGTPQYASPEQAGGETLDYRSDLYSAGAVLYELLTGRPPFAAENPAQALARVLTQPPAPFPATARIPRGLQRVTLKLLAKQREKRFASYQNLRNALLPFSSRGALGAAELARRFGAIVLDYAFLVPANLLLLPGMMLSNPGLFALSRLGPAFLYFTITDRWLGGSLGKQIFGLRVVSATGPAPGVGRIALRTAVFLLLYDGPTIVQSELTRSGPGFGRLAMALLSLAVLAVGIGLVAWTMRRGNGFAGVHDLASRTRVVVARHSEAGAAVPDEPPAAREPSDATPFGPFRPTGTVWRTAAAAFIVARDDELHREVWIHVFADAQAVARTDELQARGDGSLRWLQRGSGAGGTWDAYGAAGGIALERWVARPDRPGWDALRRVLLSLVRELEQREARAGTTGPLSLDRLWIARSGHSVLLDFPVTPPHTAADVAVAAPELVRRVARLGQDGAPPVPVYAHRVLERLEGGGQALAGVGELGRELEAVAARPATVTRPRRVATLLTPALLPALMIVVTLLMRSTLSTFPPWFRDLTLNRDAYLTALRAAPAVPPDSVARQTEAIQLVLAASLEDAKRSPQLGNQALSGLPAADRAVLDSAALRYPAPKQAAVDSARAWLASRIRPPGGPNGASVWMGFHMLGVLGIIAVVLAVLLRGPLLLNLFGMAVVHSSGAPAGRVRCGARSLIAWSPLIALPAGLNSAPIAVQAMCVALSGVGVVLSMIDPQRGPADRMLGTVLVPK